MFECLSALFRPVRFSIESMSSSSPLVLFKEAVRGGGISSTSISELECRCCCFSARRFFSSFLGILVSVVMVVVIAAVVVFVVAAGVLVAADVAVSPPRFVSPVAPVVVVPGFSKRMCFLMPCPS